MRRWLFSAVLTGMILCVQQFSFGQAQYAYRISFVNKNGTSALSDSTSFLSSRALSRRAVYGIAVDSTDLPVSPDYIDSVTSITGGVLHVTSRWLNQCVILLTDSSQIHLLDSKPYIAGSPKYVGYFSFTLHLRPGATGQKGTGVPGYYNNSWTQTSLVNGDYLHDMGFKGQGKLIAVLDMGFTGLDTHPGFDSLRNSGRIRDKHNFFRNTDIVDGYDTHGTATLSTMAGYQPDTYVGSAPLADYAIYLTEDNSAEQEVEEDQLLAGAERADSLGADVITASLGYNIFTGPVTGAHTVAELDGKTTVPAKAVNMATQKGILFVTTAGNEGGNSWDYLLTPGDADSALTIGAVNGSKIVTNYSSPGPNAAGRIKPDICMMGEAVSVYHSGGISTLSGTSMAGPQAAGYAACLLQAAPGATPYQVRKAIIESTDSFATPSAKRGYGVPDFMKALQSLDITPASVGSATVWANPVLNGRFRLMATDTDGYELSLINTDGHLVWNGSMEKGINTKEFSTGKLPAGIYLLQGKGRIKSITLKLTYR